MTRKPAREIAAVEWNLHVNDDGTYPTATIAAACAVETVRLLKAVLLTLERMEHQMLSLGGDGLHTLIRDAAKKARRREKAAREKRRAAKARR